MNRRRTVQTKSFKDYAIPLIGVVLFLAVAVSLVMNKSDDNETPNWDVIEKPKMEVSVPEEVEAYVLYENWKKIPIEKNKDILEGERLFIQSWKLKVTSPSLHLDEKTDLLFEDSNSFTLMSWNLFDTEVEKTSYSMKFATAVLSPDSIVSLTQNSVSSKIAVFEWTASVTLNSWKTFDVEKWSQAIIYLDTSNSEEINQDEIVKEIQDYELKDEWYELNNAASYLQTSETVDDENSDWENINKESLVENAWKDFLIFEIEDETSVESDKILISWDVLSNEVYKITFNWEDGNFDRASGSFSKEVPLTSNMNDIVYRVYDVDGILLKKSVLTVYSSMTQTESDTSRPDILKDTTLETYSINDEFGFTTPNPVEITNWFYTIRGFVPKWVVNHIVVNNYRLREFKPGQTTWRYHADERLWLLKDWSNLYKVEYFDADNKLITNSLYIINKVWESTKVKLYSDEAQ